MTTIIQGYAEKPVYIYEGRNPQQLTGRMTLAKRCGILAQTVFGEGKEAETKYLQYAVERGGSFILCPEGLKAFNGTQAVGPVLARWFTQCTATPVFCSVV